MGLEILPEWMCIWMMLDIISNKVLQLIFFVIIYTDDGVRYEIIHCARTTKELHFICPPWRTIQTLPESRTSIWKVSHGKGRTTITSSEPKQVVLRINFILSMLQIIVFVFFSFLECRTQNSRRNCAYLHALLYIPQEMSCSSGFHRR